MDEKPDKKEKPFAEKVFELRIFVGWTRKKMSKATGIPATTLKYWEKGLTVPPQYAQEYFFKGIQADIKKALFFKKEEES
jgi:transcriptional regulator with XRE-family HTH domain